jgi:signal peptidase I
MLLSVPLTYGGINLVFTSLLFASGFRAMEFSSSSMETTLLKKDKFLVNRNYYRSHSCDRDDLVLMRIDRAVTVKRVIAIRGDTIEGKNQQILLNGHLLDEPFIQHTMKIGANPQQDTFGPIIVPPGKYFVRGDNRDISLDSRSSDVGQINGDDIVGRPLYIYLSNQRSRWGRRLY